MTGNEALHMLATSSSVLYLVGLVSLPAWVMWKPKKVLKWLGFIAPAILVGNLLILLDYKKTEQAQKDWDKRHSIHTCTHSRENLDIRGWWCRAHGWKYAGSQDKDPHTVCAEQLADQQRKRCVDEEERKEPRP